MSTLVSIPNRVQHRSLTSSSNPSPRSCPARRHPTHFQATRGKRMDSADDGRRKCGWIFPVSLHFLSTPESCFTSILEEISISHIYSHSLGVHNWRSSPSLQLSSCASRRSGSVSMSKGASCLAHRTFHACGMHPAHPLCRCASKGLVQELNELRETLVRLPSVIRQIVRSSLLVSNSMVTSIGSVGSNSCALCLLHLISGPDGG